MLVSVPATRRQKGLCVSAKLPSSEHGHHPVLTHKRRNTRNNLTSHNLTGSSRGALRTRSALHFHAHSFLSLNPIRPETALARRSKIYDQKTVVFVCFLNEHISFVCDLNISNPNHAFSTYSCMIVQKTYALHTSPCKTCRTIEILHVSYNLHVICIF
jgi:hypothetical protein